MKKINILLLILSLVIWLVSCEENVVKIKPNEGALVPYLDGGWVSVWNDEFDGDALDETKWNYELGAGGWGNQELQYYTKNNATVSDGLLTIHAKKEENLYTSSRLTTKYKGDFKYGRVQVRAKLPSGRGTWPAIWMMPTESKYGTWPRSGEIDIMEHVGYDMNRIHANIHTRKYNHMDGTSMGHSQVIDNVAETFHIYEMIWEPDSIQILVDGLPLGIGLFKYNAAFSQDVPYHEAWPFDEHFFLILNIAVGDTWGGAQGVNEDIFPQTMEVDYVRVYQKDYHYYDGFSPDKAENLRVSTQLANSIWWNPTYDDFGVSYYEIYVNNEFYKTSNLNQTMLNDLTNGTYEIKVRAVDFTGKKGEFSDPITFTKQ
ncbi:MAG: family 16 glycosylhydrolase [Acholeplasmataceae bacterium]